jgi:hypothetical protein
MPPIRAACHRALDAGLLGSLVTRPGERPFADIPAPPGSGGNMTTESDTMSAYIVTLEEIRFLVSAAQLWDLYWYHDGKANRIHRVDDGAAATAGQMLWDENIRSVDFRYRETTDRTAYVYGRHNCAWGFRIAGPNLAIQVLRLLATYEYQACETDNWPDTEAHAFCRMLRGEAIRRLPGYESANPNLSLLADNHVAKVGAV